MPIASVSKAKRSERAEYTKEARAAVASAIKRGDRCPVWTAIPELHNGFAYGHPISGKITETHHIFGRIGRLLNWKPGHLLVSRLGHRWINSNPQEAIKLGWLAPVGCYNDFDRAQEAVKHPPYSS